MIIVVDANLMLRYVETTATHHPFAVASVAHFKSSGDELRALPQCFYEFWVVATRPVANNGLGLSTVQAELEMTGMEALFPMVLDPATLYANWRALVVAHDCKGKVAHDARIVAAMQAHGLTHLLTFNIPDFTRYPGIIVLDPRAIAP